MTSLSNNPTSYGDCPSCGYKNALSINIKDGKELYYCHAGCPQDSLWRVIRGDGPPTYPITFKSNPKRPNESQFDLIKKVWSQVLPTEKSLVETYLAERGFIKSVPGTLGYLPNHLHKPTSTQWPVMVARVTDIHGKLQSIHRTYLAKDGRGKASIVPPRMTLGPVGGYSVHLAPTEECLAVTEGIETGLSVMQETDLPVWAALSAGGIQNLVLPPLPLARKVTICADNDLNGCGNRAAYNASRRWRDEGRLVCIALPPQAGTDFNDILISKQAKEAANAFA